MPPRRDKFAWSPATFRWRSTATGRFVTEQSVAGAVRAKGAAGEKRFKRFASQLADGSLSPADWRAAMMKEIKYQHTTAVAAAHGGWQRVPAAAWLRAGRQLRQEYRYVDRLARLVDQKLIDPNSRAFKARAASYGGNARVRYAAERRRVIIEGGYQALAVWHLGSAEEHCTGCTSEAARTRQGVSAREIHQLGSHECRWFCRCKIEYKARRRTAATAP